MTHEEIFICIFLTASVLFLAVTELERLGDQRHHFWYGALLVALALQLGWNWLAWLGLVLMIDDAMQHAVQIVWPAFRSPVHLVYRYTFYRWGIRA